MQSTSATNKTKQGRLNNVAGVNGDNGVSFYTSSSFNDSAMMDVTTMGVSLKTPHPPNDKMIHVSQCKNDKCPLQHVWKNQQYSINKGKQINYQKYINNEKFQDLDHHVSEQNILQAQSTNVKESKEFDQQFIPFYACPKCVGDTVKYCSQRCFQQDWFKTHQFECSGQKPEARDSVLLTEVQRIEATTPFIKEGNDESTLTPEQIRLEQMFSSITKKDLEFIQGRESNLGKGSYGEVQLAKHKATNVLIAVKKIEKASLTSSKIKETLIREIRIQKQLNHEYICRLYTSFEDKDTIYLSLEYASKGNLFYLIRKEKYLSEDTAFYFFIQVCSGIYYMHKQGLIHRDIKPENILIKEGNIIKICDFGWCVQSDHSQQRNTFCGTLEYMAPEMIQNKAHNHTLDIWSLGILLYELVHGRAPFTGVHPREISDKIMRGVIRFKPGLSNEYKDLVNSILKYETTERLPLIKVFDHPWVKNFEKKYNLNKVVPPPKKDMKEIEKKKAQEAAKAKALAEAAEKQRQAELEAAAKEAERQEKIKQQQREQELLILKQKQMEEAERKRREKEAEEERKKTAALAAQAAAAAAAAMAAAAAAKAAQDDIVKQLEDHVTENQQNQQTKKYLNDIQDENKLDVSDYCDKMMKDLSHLDKQLEQKKKTKSEEEIAEEKEKHNQQKLAMIQQQQLQQQKIEQEKERLKLAQTMAVMSPTYSKKKGDRNLNNSINIRSNKKAMHPNQRKQSEKQEVQYQDEIQSPGTPSESDQSLDLPSMRSEVQTPKPKREVLACNLRIDTTMKAFERQGGRQMFEENLAASLGISMSSVQVTGLREGSVIVDYNLIVDKNSKMSIDELKSLQNEKMKSGAIEVGGPVLSFTSTLPTPTPTPDDDTRSKKSSKKLPEPQPLPTESEQESESEIFDQEEPSARKKQAPPEVEQQKTTENEFENLSNEFSDEQESEESEEEEESEESSSEDEDTKREIARKNRKKQQLKGMDPIYDSSSGADDIKKSKRSNQMTDGEDEFSSDEEQQSFMQKLGGFLFFGCGGGKDNIKAKK